MSLKLKFCLLSLLFCSNISAQDSPVQLSEEAEVILLILDPTQSELYSAFGHSAFRVNDPVNRIDLIFNYGVFDFDQPNFYLNFTKGKLYYKLGMSNYQSYKKYYFRTDRTFREHVLQLAQADKQGVYDYLINNVKPENANYYYNYCYDNCATKMRDVINEVLGDRITYDYSYAADSMTFRGLMDRYLDDQPWGDFGIDVCLGSQIDEVANGSDYMYMPEYLEEAFLTATIAGDSSSRPLVSSTTTINVTSEKPTVSIFKPIHLFIGVFMLVGLIIHRSLKYSVTYRFIDVILYGVTGLLGVGLLLLWLATDHLSAYNYNLIWAMPFHLIALVLLLGRNRSMGLRYYFIIFGWSQVLLLVFRELLPQQLHVALIPLVLALALRSFYLAYELKVKK